MRQRKTVWVFVLLVSLVFGTSLLAGGPGKRPLSPNDFDSWKAIYQPKISNDGNWICYLETPQDGDAYVVALNLKTGRQYRQSIGYSGEGTDAERAAIPQFSADAGFLIFLISPDKETAKKARQKKKGKNDQKAKKKLGIMNLRDGMVTEIDSVKSFAMPEKAAGWLAYLKEPTEKKEKEKPEEEKSEEEKKIPEKKQKGKKKEYGSPLVLRSLKDGSEKVFADVLHYRFLKNGRYLFYVVSSKTAPESDGVYRIEPGSRDATPILTGKGRYTRWALNKKETVLAFLTDRDDQDSDSPVFSLYGCKIKENKATLWVSHTITKGFPEGMAVSDKSDLTFSEEGDVLLFGIKEIEAAQTEKEDTTKIAEEKAKFDLWHWNDPYPQPQQKKMAKRVRDNTWECVYHVKSHKFVRLADEKLPDLALHPGGKWAFASNPWPYTKLVSYFGTFVDFYLVDTKTGARTLVKQKLYRTYGGNPRLSPNGRYVTYFENDNWFIYDVKKKISKNMTKNLSISFSREDWDTPNPAGSYGIAGWTDGDASVLVYDRYDIWEFRPDGSPARMITEGYGRQHHLSFRYVNLDPEKRTIPRDEPLLLRTTNEETMASGFYRDKVAGNAPPEKLLMEDKSFGRPTRAKKAQRLLFSRQAFDEFPDLWVSDLNFSTPRKVTDLGRQMNPFLWGKAELLDFVSSDGKPLKGILIKPENFTPEKKYPLLVYIYETLHYNLHRFRHPSPGTSINPSFYVSNGYILWMPDIEYDTGYPGRDALKCVLPGIQMLVQKGFIDEHRIGIQGHSWGGYQIAYMVTQTNIFTAAEAGAPVSNMISSYDGIRWGSGMVRQFQYEHTQSRLGASLWEVPMRYIENSPIFWADKVQTPLLMIHNDNDGAVPWYQGIEYIMALRRLGKKAYLFNYNGENHGLRKRVNQKDWTIRMQQFFDHYLKGAPMPDWMKNGIKAWEKEEEKEEQ